MTQGFSLAGAPRAQRRCFGVAYRETIHFQPEMELESDTYDVVVIGTGLAESIAAA